MLLSKNKIKIKSKLIFKMKLDNDDVNNQQEEVDDFNID